MELRAWKVSFVGKESARKLELSFDKTYNLKPKTVTIHTAFVLFT